MFKSFVSFFCILWAFTFSLFAVSEGTVQGTVTDSITTLALSNVQITIYKNNQIHAQTTTNGSGFYTITTTPDKKYVIVASLAGYQSQSQGLIIEKNQTTIANFALQPNPGTLIVTTKDEYNTIVPNATVTVYQNNIPIATGTSNPSGTITFNTLAPGSYTVVASKTGYATTAGQALITAGQTTNLTLLMALQHGTLSGNVKGDGVNLENVLIELLLNNILITSTLTDSSGNYTITEINPNIYTVHAHITGFSSGVQGVLISANTTTTANFALSSLHGSVSGNVTNSSSDNLAGVTIEVLQNNVLINSTLTDFQGNYFINSLDPGSYILHAHDPGYQSGISGVIISDQQTSVVNFVLTPDPCSLSGVVTDTHSNPLALATVEVNLNNIVIFSTLTNTQGQYLIEGISAGDYIIHAHASGYSTGSQGISFNPGDQKTLNFALAALEGSVSGNVSSSQEGNLSGVTIEVLQNDILINSTITDYFGNYSVSGLLPGSYIMHAHDPRYQSGISGVIISDQQTSVVNFVLTPDPCSLSGKVTDTLLNPLPSATVEVNLGNVILFSTLTDPDGNYLIAGVAPGSYVLHAHDTGYISGIVSKDLSSGTNYQNFNLQSTALIGSLQGTVKDVYGVPIPGAVVELNLNNITLFYTASGPDGTYNFSNIPYNTYVLHCHKTLYQTGVNTITINNPSSTYNFVLQSLPSRIQGYVNAHSSGSPIQGALAVLYYNGVYISTAVSGPTGFYDQPGLPAGNYQIFIGASGYISTNSSFTLGSFQTFRQNFTLYSTAAVTEGKATLSLNRCGLQTQRVYLLSWQPSTDPAVKSYAIYRNSQKIASLALNNAPIYQDKTPPNSSILFYKIVSLDKQNKPIGELNVYPQ